MSLPLYKIVTQADWQVAQMTGFVPLSAVDARDGFIHLSTVTQYITTANLYFSDDSRPLAIEFDSTHLGGELRWEWSEQRQADFPHLYTTQLSVTAADAVVELMVTDQGFAVYSRTPLTDCVDEV